MSKSRVVMRSTAGKAVDAVVAEVMRLCDWEGVVPRGATVVVKPNLCTPSRELREVANTSPEVLSAVCALLKDRTSNVIIAESDGVRYTAEETFEINGTCAIGKRFGFQVMSLSKDEIVPVDHPHLKGWGLPKTLLQCDVFMTVAKIKTHATTTFTGALKNQWGCIAQHDRMLIHKYLDTLIGDLNKILRPRLGLLDGLIAMEGRGPVNGRPVRLDLIAASRDVVALDAAAMRIVGLDPATAAHIVHAARIGVGRMAEEEIELDADSIAPRRFEPAEKDWPIVLLNWISRSRFLTRHVVMNDAIFFPGRRFANFCRSVKARVVGKRSRPQDDAR